MTTGVAGDYIEDILNALLDIQDFIAEYSYEQFVNDRKTQYAVIRAIEIIGEASKNLPLEIREKISGCTMERYGYHARQANSWIFWRGSDNFVGHRTTGYPPSCPDFQIYP